MVAVGDVIEGVKLDELAAQGGSSMVFRGTDRATGEPKAVKVLLKPEASATRRLRREAALLARLHHPTIVGFHGIAEDSGTLALITDWIDGTSLLARQRVGEQLSLPEVVALMQPLAAGLDYLHSEGVVHRDVSPANIMLCNDDAQPVLVDLGIGHAVGESTMTNHDLLAGTASYLAPELIQGHPASARSDQYGLAIIAYELITGVSPFPAAESVASALHHQLHTAPVPVDELQPVASHIALAIERAVSKDPSQRFGSVTEFAQALASARPAHLAPPAPAAPPAAARSRRIAIAAVVTAIVVLGGLFWWTSDAGNVTSGVAAEADGLTLTTTASEPPAPIATWAPGDSATLPCNLLTGHVFENGSVPTDYFGRPPGRERVVDQGGYADSWALEVGIANNFSQYGEIIPVVPGESYVFSGWFFRSGEIADTNMGISFLDTEFQLLEISTSTDLTSVPDGFAQTTFQDVPATAGFAVPFLFKDSSSGVLLADELVFGLQDACSPALDLRGG